MPVWHLSSDSLVVAPFAPRYVRLSGPASAPVVEADVVVNTEVNAGPTTFGIWSVDEGATLWICGPTNVTLGRANQWLRSTDGGATWVNKSQNLQSLVLSIGGFAGDPALVSGVEAWGTAGAYLYNVPGDVWNKQQATADYGNSIWAVPGTDIVYMVAGNEATNQTLWYSLDRGVSWAQDASYTSDAGAGTLQVVTDPRDGLIWTASPNGKFRYGYRGGGWTVETPFAFTTTRLEGRSLCCDETGAVWFFNPTDSKLYRRDPTSGVWASPLTTAGFHHGGLWVVDSENIMLCGGNGRIYIWDGSSWYTHLAVADIGLTESKYFGVWGVGDAAPGCPDSIIIPADPIVTGGFINNQAKNFSAEYQTNAGCRTFVVPFLYGSAGKSVRKRITAPSSSLG